MIQLANAVVTSKKHPEIRNRYLSIKTRRGHKKAIIAITRMRLTAIFHILKNSVAYNADFYKKYEAIPTTREITVEQAVTLAKRQGFVVTVS